MRKLVPMVICGLLGLVGGWSIRGRSIRAEAEVPYEQVVINFPAGTGDPEPRDWKTFDLVRNHPEGGGEQGLWWVKFVVRGKVVTQYRCRPTPER